MLPQVCWQRFSLGGQQWNACQRFLESVVNLVWQGWQSGVEYSNRARIPQTTLMVPALSTGRVAGNRLLAST